MSKFNITDKSPLEVVQNVMSLSRDYSTQSLSEYTSPTRLSPIVLIDKALTFIEDDSLQNILQTINAIYSAHYLQAVAIATNIEGINTVQLLDQFATNRNLATGGVLSGYLGNEEREEGNSKLFMYPNMEAGESDNNLQQNVNLAIGRLLHVKIGVGDKSVTIPINVVLNPLVINSDVLPSVLAMTEQDTGFINRYHQWRSGEIESFTDYIFALDLIENDRKALLNDENGVYKEARLRKSKGMFATILTGRVSLNNASSMAVVTKQTGEALEVALKGKLKNRKVINAYFNGTNSMLLVVVDVRKERLKIYQRGISEVGTYTFSDIVSASTKTNGMDITSILKAYKLGDSPSL